MLDARDPGTKTPSGTVVHDRRGAVAIEYGVLAAMIAIALVGMASLTGVADNQSSTYEYLSDSMSN